MATGSATVSLAGDTEGAHVLVAVDRAAWRTFGADRIADVTPTGHRFQFTNPPDAADLVSCASGVAPYRLTARVVVHTTQAECEEPAKARSQPARTDGLDDPARHR